MMDQNVIQNLNIQTKYTHKQIHAHILIHIYTRTYTYGQNVIPNLNSTRIAWGHVSSNQWTNTHTNTLQTHTQTHEHTHTHLTNTHTSSSKRKYNIHEIINSKWINIK